MKKHHSLKNNDYVAFIISRMIYVADDVLDNEWDRLRKIAREFRYSDENHASRPLIDCVNSFVHRHYAYLLK